jgi:hypothetical protein
VWRNGRRTGLKNVKVAIFGRFFWPLLMRCFTSVYRPKITFNPSSPCLINVPLFILKSGTKSGTRNSAKNSANAQDLVPLESAV